MQILTACLKSFAHGANDVSNAAGPFAAVAVLHRQGLDSACGHLGTPLWVLAWCGLGLVAVCPAGATAAAQGRAAPADGGHAAQGLSLLGHKVRLCPAACRLAAAWAQQLKSALQVMKTIGSGLTAINYSRGFSIELGSTLSVVLASVAGMPISSTHCQVGSVIAVGIAQGGLGSVRWSLLGSIAITWLITVPLAAAASAGLLAAARPLLT